MRYHNVTTYIWPPLVPKPPSSLHPPLFPASCYSLPSGNMGGFTVLIQELWSAGLFRVAADIEWLVMDTINHG